MEMEARMTLEEYKTALANSSNFKSLFHFTDKANLPSIFKYGILSKKTSGRQKIEIAAPGGNKWSHDADEYKELGDYVNLCFTTNHPMCYFAGQDGRIPNPEYLPIRPDVLSSEGVKITLDVSNKVGTELFNLEDGLEKLDIEVLYTRTNWKNPDIQRRLRIVEKCEILVPKTVPTNLILRNF
jgi:hypothetical protein